jgi:hypothetical protein
MVAPVIEDLALVPADGGFVQRAKALACTAPLHDLDARKSQLQGGEFNRYQMSELALHAIDLVTLAMDFDRGASHEQIVADLVPLAAMQAPDQPPSEHKQVARWVLSNLINVGSADRGFRAVYGVASAQGTYQRHWFDFKLLVELVSEAGEVYLRATDEAVNVLIGALDTDIESAQIAADLKLETLIRRGKLSHAQAAAEQARYRTIQYAETLRRRLESTRRDVRTVDWLREMPALITAALDHIESRYQAENAILVNLTTTRDTAETSERKRQAARLIEIVRECLRRHEQLQTRLQEAGRAFRAEQDRQTFTPQPNRVEIDLHGQVLVPVLRLALEDAAAVVGAFFDAATGLAVPPVPRLWDLTERLLAPPAEHDHLGAELPEPELVERPDPHASAMPNGRPPRSCSAALATCLGGCPSCSPWPAPTTQSCPCWSRCSPTTTSAPLWASPSGRATHGSGSRSTMERRWRTQSWVGPISCWHGRGCAAPTPRRSARRMRWRDPDRRRRRCGAPDRLRPAATAHPRP